MSQTNKTPRYTVMARNLRAVDGSTAELTETTLAAISTPTSAIGANGTLLM